MIRLFSTRSHRSVHALDGAWELVVPEEGSEIAPGDAGRRFVLDVPGVWEQIPELVNYRGEALLRRRVVVSEGGYGQLVFAGVSHTATVWWDGREVAHHHNAFTAFSAELGRVEAGEHEVVVHVSNAHGELSGLHIPNDYYNYGGISRPVELQLRTHPVALVGVAYTPVGRPGVWRLDWHAEIAADQAWSGELAIAVAGQESPTPVELPAGGGEVSGSIDLGDAATWRPLAPALHQAVATLAAGDGAVVDDLHERVGLRTVRCAGERVLVNDEPVFLVGFNRHEDHAQYGCAIPVAQMRRDIAQLLELGSNAVRTSHYPNDERFLDLCDEHGLLVWEENHARGQGIEAMRHPRFREQCYRVTEEMLAQHRNHPSIVIWGVMNECASEDPEGRAMYAEQLDYLREHDPSRPTTYASCRHGRDICQDLPDICSWNVYPAWYGDETAGLGRVVDTTVEQNRSGGLGDKPLIISETGAGALPGYHDPIRRGKWSEDRQRDILLQLVADIGHHPRICGLFLWQYCDVRVDESWAIKRPRCMNNKGIVDEWRRPKLGYPELAAALHELRAARSPAG